MISVRLAAWAVCALALAVALSLVAPGLAVVVVLTLVVPIAVLVWILHGRHANGEEADAAQALLLAAAPPSGERSSATGEQVDWGAALGAELASITVPRERRQFALGAALAMLGTTHRLRSGLLAVATAAAFAAVLLGFSRSSMGHEGLGSVSVLVPAVMLFAIGYVCAWSTGSLRFAAETGILAAFTTLVAVAVVLGVEAVRWFDVAHVFVLDGDYADVGSSRAAVFDALNPIILLVHLLFWLPWPVLGAIAGVRTSRRGAPLARSSS